MSINRYFPYGGLRANDAIATTDRGFLGQTEDAATGLDYLNNRYLDPTFGRFISVDPLISMTRDAYGYGNNNPITFSDPSGLCSTVVNGELVCGGGTHVSLDGSGTSELVDIDPGSGGQQGRVFRDSARAVTKVTWMDGRSGPKGDFTDAWRRVNDPSYDPHDAPVPKLGIDAGCWFAACLQTGMDKNGLWLNFGFGLGMSSPGLILTDRPNSAEPRQSTELTVNASYLIRWCFSDVSL